MSSNNCQIQNSSERGEGLYSLKPFKKGDIVYQCTVQESNIKNQSHASQVGMEQWVKFDLLGRSINHSCDPNCGIGFDGQKWSYKAFKDINIGDELTYDYAMANYKVENFPVCLCGSKKCRKQIKGFRNLPEQRKKEYLGFLAPYLQKIARQEFQTPQK